MFERWRRESFFKYLREEFLLDALADYRVEPDDLTRSVPNPARRALDQDIRRARAEVAKLATERKHLINLIKMVARQTESDLLA